MTPINWVFEIPGISRFNGNMHLNRLGAIGIHLGDLLGELIASALQREIGSVDDVFNSTMMEDIITNIYENNAVNAQYSSPTVASLILADPLSYSVVNGLSYAEAIESATTLMCGIAPYILQAMPHWPMIGMNAYVNSVKVNVMDRDSIFSTVYVNQISVM